MLGFKPGHVAGPVAILAYMPTTRGLRLILDMKGMISCLPSTIDRPSPPIPSVGGFVALRLKHAALGSMPLSSVSGAIFLGISVAVSESGLEMREGI